MTIAEFFASLSDTARLVILSASIIIALMLFTKTVKLLLKTAVILVMLLLIAYFLRQAGIL